MGTFYCLVPKFWACERHVFTSQSNSKMFPRARQTEIPVAVHCIRMHTYTHICTHACIHTYAHTHMLFVLRYCVFVFFFCMSCITSLDDLFAAIAQAQSRYQQWAVSEPQMRVPRTSLKTIKICTCIHCLSLVFLTHIAFLAFFISF